ncbi:acyltransferase [uncultured Enterococcus sp.]|uniref:acyltransferase n=1 Tax=uncultured Enterococcus sp. TaxID=167972 RepID=UPI002AA7F8B8|nr:acyltransferase [uncultured Enterococcus sp.]
MRNTKKNLQMIDLLKFIAAIMVVCIHSNQISENEWLNFLVKNILCRIAVPLFFISSAYFIRKSTAENGAYLKKKLFHLVKEYLFWSVVFIPIGLDWINQNLSISQSLYPAALLFGLSYSGTYYHLWYIPALILSILIIATARHYLSYKWIFFIAFLLYLLGSVETYYGLITSEWFKALFDGFIRLFFTTRNGLFYGLVFTAMGFFLSDYEEKLLQFRDQFKLGLFFCSSLLFAEGIVIFNILRLDCNFLIALVPVSFILFFLGITTTVRLPFNTAKLRELSHYYYFIHPICILLVLKVGSTFKLSFFTEGLGSFLLIYLLTHFLSMFIIGLKKRSVAKFVWLSSHLKGLVCIIAAVNCLFIFDIVPIPIQFKVAICLLSCYAMMVVVLISKILQLRETRISYSLGKNTV